MNIEVLREYCISKKKVTECMPFGEDTLVFKTEGRIFAMANLEGELTLNLKCDPVLAVELRERHSSVIPGYHMNKRHWITILLDESVSEAKTLDFLDMSYDLIDSGK